MSLWSRLQRRVGDLAGELVLDEYRDQLEQAQRLLAKGDPAAAIEVLEALLAKMNEEQREVFVLHELEHMSGIEIAQITGANENTVWSRLRAARKIFQEGVAREKLRGAREQA